MPIPPLGVVMPAETNFRQSSDRCSGALGSPDFPGSSPEIGPCHHPGLYSVDVVARTCSRTVHIEEAGRTRTCRLLLRPQTAQQVPCNAGDPAVSGRQGVGPAGAGGTGKTMVPGYGERVSGDAARRAEQHIRSEPEICMVLGKKVPVHPMVHHADDSEFPSIDSPDRPSGWSGRAGARTTRCLAPKV